MARLYLGITATSVPAEQIFSIAGQILTKRRVSLTDNMVNTILCARNWLGFCELEKKELVYGSQIIEQAQELDRDGDFIVTDDAARWNESEEEL